MIVLNCKELKYSGEPVYVEVANRDGKGQVITDTYITKKEFPLLDSAAADGTYTLKAIVSGGVITYSWTKTD